MQVKLQRQSSQKWSCEFSNEDCQHANEFGLELKVLQLIPKDAFFGGHTEAINLWTTLTDEDMENRKRDSLLLCDFRVSICQFTK